MEPTSDLQICSICNKDVENDAAHDVVTLTAKGCEGISKANILRRSNISVEPGDKVHSLCRKSFTNHKEIQRFLGSPCTNNDLSVSDLPTVLRSKGTFDYKTQCILCGSSAKKSGLKRGANVSAVKTDNCDQTLREICKQRNDEWGNEVFGRVQFTSDLHAFDAIYHHQCSTNFRTFKSKPGALHSAKKGRPSTFNESFLHAATYLRENSDSQISVSDLVEKMSEHCGSENAYGQQYMKDRLKEHFGNDVVVTEINGKPNIVTLTSTVKSIVHDFYKRPKTKDFEEEKNAIIKTAAALIREDVRAVESSVSQYPSAEEISSQESLIEFLPASLRTFLSSMILVKEKDLKISSIGHAIMQAIRPRNFLAPLQISLGVQLHHQFGSRFLLDTLNKLGFCASYTEVQSYERCAAVFNAENDMSIQDGDCIQYIADNVDHNTRTLDGFGTFHGMGILAGITPNYKFGNAIPKRMVSKEQIASFAKINIEYYSNDNVKELLFDTLNPVLACDKAIEIEQLYNIVRPLKSPIYGWSGLMQIISKGVYPGKSSFQFLPMIDMDPTNLSCIYSTLKYIAVDANKLGRTPIVTFDQPLYFKALAIVNNEDVTSDIKNIVLRLGGFHTEMSFVGSICKIMHGSGFQELLECIYAPNTVPHIISGKAIARAVRGLFLIDAALHALLMKEAFGITISGDLGEGTQCLTNDLLTELQALFDRVLDDHTSVDSLAENPYLQRAVKTLESIKSVLRSSRTSHLWLNLLKQIALLKQFIKAERTGNWNLHLRSLREMLPYFAATGHNLYTKSVHLYLSKMQSLEVDQPEVFQHFQNGHHVLRRSDRFWGGLSTDLIIEQVLMRSLKTTGGLTRGRGIDESQRAQWILAMPSCAEYNNAMQDLTGTTYISSDQHKETSTARVSRDHTDIQSLIAFLKDRNPFAPCETLRNIETGEVSSAKVTADQAEETGEKILQSMTGKSVAEFTFKKSAQIVCLGAGNKSSIDAEIQIDPQVMFQRCIALSKNVFEDTSSMFEYELSAIPPSLFDNNGLPRVATKSHLLDSVWSLGECFGDVDYSQDIHYVVDGGSLIQRLPWDKGSTFQNIYQMYVDHLKRKYSPHVTVVFDGYPQQPSTKDIAHMRRTKGIKSPDVSFHPHMTFKCKKEHFLGNTANKQRFIDQLCLHCRSNLIHCIQVAGDADLTIALTGISCNKDMHTVVLGEDTDLLVLLLHHYPGGTNDLILKSAKTTTKMDLKRKWDIKKTQELLGVQGCSIIPFIHAYSGCDSTSRMYGIGKAAVFKKRTSPVLYSNAKVFMNAESTKEDIKQAGEEVAGLLYGAMPEESMNILRWRKFVSKTSSGTSCVQIHALPPTTDALYQHSLRVFHQCQEWLGNALNVLNYGWHVKDNKLFPVYTKADPAPKELLKIIHCNCKQHCDTLRCTCRKNGLVCSTACGECHGVNCTNTGDVDLREDV